MLKELNTFKILDLRFKIEEEKTGYFKVLDLRLRKKRLEILRL